MASLYSELFNQPPENRYWYSDTLFGFEKDKDFFKEEDAFSTAMLTTFDEIKDALNNEIKDVSGNAPEKTSRISAALKIFCSGPPKTGWKKIIQIIETPFITIKNIVKLIFEGIPRLIEHLSAKGFIACDEMLKDQETKDSLWRKILAQIGRTACAALYGISFIIRHLVQPITSPIRTLKHAMEIDGNSFGRVIPLPIFTLATCLYIAIVYVALISSYVLASFTLGPVILQAFESIKPLAAAIKTLSMLLSHIFDPILRPIFHTITDEMRVITFLHGVFAARFTAPPIKIAMTKIALFCYYKAAAAISAMAIFFGSRNTKDPVKDKDVQHSHDQAEQEEKKLNGEQSYCQVNAKLSSKPSWTSIKTTIFHFLAIMMCVSTSCANAKRGNIQEEPTESLGRSPSISISSSPEGTNLNASPLLFSNR